MPRPQFSRALRFLHLKVSGQKAGQLREGQAAPQPHTSLSSAHRPGKGRTTCCTLGLMRLPTCDPPRATGVFTQYPLSRCEHVLMACEHTVDTPLRPGPQCAHAACCPPMHGMALCTGGHSAQLALEPHAQ